MTKHALISMIALTFLQSQRFRQIEEKKNRRTASIAGPASAQAAYHRPVDYLPPKKTDFVRIAATYISCP